MVVRCVGEHAPALPAQPLLHLHPTTRGPEGETPGLHHTLSVGDVKEWYIHGKDASVWPGRTLRDVLFRLALAHPFTNAVSRMG